MSEIGTQRPGSRDLLGEVRDAIETGGLLGQGDIVVVGVSGGADSLCLLHVLHTLAPEYDLSLHVAHLHHGLRGADADADAAFVQAVAAQWRLPFTAGHVDVSALALEEGRAFEEAARRARYAFLRQVALDTGARTVAVGHNAGDQAETVLMHFIRGSGLAGLRGMRPRTPLAAYRLPDDAGSDPTVPRNLPSIHLIRPLLTIPRTAILAYLAGHDLQPRFDRSNLDTTYFRNWLRHEVIPLLEQHNPNVQEVIRRTAEVVADDYALIRDLLADTWPEVVLSEDPAQPGEESGGRIVFDLAAWRALPVALQRSSLREAVHRLRRSLRNINFVHIEDAATIARDGTTGDRATLPRELMLAVGYETLTIAGAGVAPSLPDWPLLPEDAGLLPVAIPGATPLPGSDWQLQARFARHDALPPGWDANPDPWLAYLDADVASGALYLRTRYAGDRFEPLGMDGQTVKLADLLTNEKVPAAARDHLPLLVRDEDILWVCGVRVAERARVREGTRAILVLRFVDKR